MNNILYDDIFIPPVDASDLVMRSINLLRVQDDVLCKISYKTGVSKSHIIRAAIAIKIDEWTSSGNTTFLTEVKLGNIGIDD